MSVKITYEGEERTLQVTPFLWRRENGVWENTDIAIIASAPRIQDGGDGIYVYGGYENHSIEICLHNTNDIALHLEVQYEHTSKYGYTERRDLPCDLKANEEYSLGSFLIMRNNISDHLITISDAHGNVLLKLKFNDRLEHDRTPSPHRSSGGRDTPESFKRPMRERPVALMILQLLHSSDVT